MKKATSDMFMFIPSAVVHHFEGENDGLLSPHAVEWTNFKGVFRSGGKRGISHCDEIDMRRRKLSKNGNGINDITDFYLSVAAELKDMGY